MVNSKGFLITITGEIEIFEDETVEEAIDYVANNLDQDEIKEHLNITGKELDY